MDPNQCYRKFFRIYSKITGNSEFFKGNTSHGRVYDNQSLVLLDATQQMHVPTVGTRAEGEQKATSNNSILLYMLTGCDNIYFRYGYGEREEIVFQPTQKRLGGGAYGTVYEYQSSGTLKTIYITVKKFQDQRDFDEEKESVKNLRNAFQSTFKVCHSCTVVIKAMYNDENRCIIMPKAAGDMRHFIRGALEHNNGRLDQKSALYISIEIVAMTMALRCANLFQIDLKTQNMLFHMYEGKPIVLIGDIGGIVHYTGGTIYPPSTFICPYACAYRDGQLVTRIQNPNDMNRHMKWVVGCTLCEIMSGDITGFTHSKQSTKVWREAADYAVLSAGSISPFFSGLLVSLFDAKNDTWDNTIAIIEQNYSILESNRGAVSQIAQKVLGMGMEMEIDTEHLSSDEEL